MLAVLHGEDSEVDICICSDSSWVIQAFGEWMLIWIHQDMKSADGQPIACSRYLLHAWELVTVRIGSKHLLKVRAHRRDIKEISNLHNKVDQLAKEAALLGEETLWIQLEGKVAKVGSKAEDLTNQPDLKEMQKIQQFTSY